jgi:5'-3' exonuclease
LGEPGWKERYYEEKFSAQTPEELDAIRKDVVSWKIEVFLVLSHEDLGFTYCNLFCRS